MSKRRRASASIGDGHGQLDDEGRFTIEASLGDLDLSGGPQRVTLEAEVTDVDEQVVTGRQFVEHRLWQTTRLGPEHEGIVRRIGDPVVALLAACREGEPARRSGVGQKRGKIGMLPHLGEFAIVKPGTPQAFVVEGETERMDDVERVNRVAELKQQIAKNCN